MDFKLCFREAYCSLVERLWVVLGRVVDEVIENGGGSRMSCCGGGLWEYGEVLNRGEVGRQCWIIVVGNYGLGIRT